MNNRIKELAESANYLATEKEFPYDEDWVYLYTQKFAELIVRECMHVAIHKSDGIFYTADIAGYMAAGRENAANMIKKHFGIDE